MKSTFWGFQSWKFKLQENLIFKCKKINLVSIKKPFFVLHDRCIRRNRRKWILSLDFQIFILVASNRIVMDWKTPWRSSGENIVTFREAQNCEKTWAGCLNSEVFLSQNILILFFSKIEQVIMIHSDELTHGTPFGSFPLSSLVILPYHQFA